LFYKQLSINNPLNMSSTGTSSQMSRFVGRPYKPSEDCDAHREWLEKNALTRKGESRLAEFILRSHYSNTPKHEVEQDELACHEFYKRAVTYASTFYDPRAATKENQESFNPDGYVSRVMAMVKGYGTLIGQYKSPCDVVQSLTITGTGASAFAGNRKSGAPGDAEMEREVPAGSDKTLQLPPKCASYIGRQRLGRTRDGLMRTQNSD
jgi:hypothetical protein